MKLIDTPNPNAKKIESELTSHLKDGSLEQALYENHYFLKNQVDLQL